jgi:hypothetical protein
MVTVNLEFETNVSSHMTDVFFKALRDAVERDAGNIEIEILTSAMVASMRASKERFETEDRIALDKRESETINHAVAAGRSGKLSDAVRAHLGRLRSDKIENALKTTPEMPGE